MGLKAWLFGEKRNHDAANKFKAGTRPAIILETLCEGVALSGWAACKLLKTHNGDRDLRRVRKRLRSAGVQFLTFLGQADNGREYKITQLLPSQRDNARKLIVGKGV